LLSYIRSYLIIKNNEELKLLKISQPCKAKFEVRTLEQAILVLRVYYTNRFTTKIESDMKTLQTQIPQRKAFAIIYRISRKRIILKALRYMSVLLGIMNRIVDGMSLKDAYLKIVDEYEDASEMHLNRRVLRKYLHLYDINQKLYNGI
jgi:hypothetical protein